MKATYFVNTMLLLEGRNSRVLCDPWITFDRTSDCDFYNFPETSISREQVRAIKPDFIYVTHSHPDHFDPATLRLFDPATPVVIARFDNPFFERAVRRVGFTDIRVCHPEEGTPLNGDDRVWSWPSAHAPDVDSIAVMRIDGELSVNANDNTFHEEQCRFLAKKFGRIDIGFLPFGAHGPYPMFYESLTDAERDAKAQHRKIRVFKSLVAYIQALGTPKVVPFAGGLISGGHKATRYKWSGIATRSEAVAFASKEVAFEPIFLSEGNSFDFTTNQRFGTYVEKSYASEAAYVADIATKRNRFEEGGRFHISPSEQIDLTALLQTARQKQAKWQGIKQTTSRSAYYFDVGQPHLYRLSLADETVTKLKRSEITEEAYEIFEMPYGLLVGLLTRHYNWSNVKTQYVNYYRKPDILDRDLHLLMSFLHV